mgnify:CR=1 FL=1
MLYIIVFNYIVSFYLTIGGIFLFRLKEEFKLMLFFKQIFLKTNCSLFVPDEAQVRNIEVVKFERKGAVYELPALIYGWWRDGDIDRRYSSVSYTHLTLPTNREV